MKVTEITEGWGDALKNVASGFLQGATGIKPSIDADARTRFIKEFVSKINSQLRRAIQSGTVSTEAGFASPASAPNQWVYIGPPSSGRGRLISGMDHKTYTRDDTGKWTAPPATAGGTPLVFAPGTPHAAALDKAMDAVIAAQHNAHAGGDATMPWLTEQRYKKLNGILEQLMVEADPARYSISDFLTKLVKSSYPTITPAQENTVKPMCDSAQKNYENPANFLQDLNKIGALIYSFIKK